MPFESRDPTYDSPPSDFSSCACGVHYFLAHFPDFTILCQVRNNNKDVTVLVPVGLLFRSVVEVYCRLFFSLCYGMHSKDHDGFH